MRSLAIAISTLLMVVDVKLEDIDIDNTNILDHILVYPIPAPESLVKKREVSKDNTENLNEFVEEKLTQHTQALEHIVQKMDSHEDLMKQLIAHLSTLEKPKMPTKVDTEKVKEHLSRRSNSYIERTENPVVRLGKNIPIYGRLAKDLFMKEIQSDTDPIPLVETNPDESSPKYTRRSFGDNPSIDQNQIKKEELNPWCEAAMLCKKTGDTICGFDDNYGYGKFDDICHLQHVNCFYKYNFALIHTCHPTL